MCVLQGQGAITEKLRSLSMHDLTQISQQNDRGGDQLYQYSSQSANPAVRRSQSTDGADEAGTHKHTHLQRHFPKFHAFPQIASSEIVQ